MKQKTLKLLLISIILIPLLIAGCESSENSDSYLNKFQAFQGKVIEFKPDNQPLPIESPFDNKSVYPYGKIEMKSGIALAFITIWDGGEPYGEVDAELIINGMRKDRIEVAVGDMGYHKYAELNLPFIRVISSGTEGPIDTTTYKIVESSFEEVK